MSRTSEIGRSVPTEQRGLADAEAAEHLRRDAVLMRVVDDRDENLRAHALKYDHRHD